MKLLDLFCGAGGAAMGYHRAGFDEIVGVDNRQMPRYPFTFVLGDALEYVREHGHEFDAIHASPPCQAYVQRNKNLFTNHPRLIEPIRELLLTSGLLYIIENVPGAPLRNPVILCGTMFDLLLLRHRLFETNWGLSIYNNLCNHWGSVASGDFAAVYSKGGKGHRHGRDTEGKKLRDPGPKTPGPSWEVAMGINWMNHAELSQAIPPAYTEFIGRQLLAVARPGGAQVSEIDLDTYGEVLGVIHQGGAEGEVPQEGEAR